MLSVVGRGVLHLNERKRGTLRYDVQYLCAGGLSRAQDGLLEHLPVSGAGAQDPWVDQLYDGVELLQVILDGSTWTTTK